MLIYGQSSTTGGIRSTGEIYVMTAVIYGPGLFDQPQHPPDLERYVRGMLLKNKSGQSKCLSIRFKKRRGSSDRPA
jgi:hypothetical protein